MKKGWKAYDKGLVCRGKTYEEGKIFEEEKAEMCRYGMHYCDNPVDLMHYHDLIDTFGNLMEVTEVEDLSNDVISEDDGHSKKYVTTKLKIGRRVGFAEWVDAVVHFCINECNDASGGADSQLASSEDEFSLCATSEDHSRIVSSGDASSFAIAGCDSQLVSSGDYSQLATTGDYSQLVASGNVSFLASSGSFSQLVSSGLCSRLATSGNYSRLATSGDYSQLASSGNCAQLAALGGSSVVAAIGINNMARATKGSWIVLAEYDTRNKPIHVKARKVDGKRIKANTFYCLKNGKFKIVGEEE